ANVSRGTANRSIAADEGAAPIGTTLRASPRSRVGSAYIVMSIGVSTADAGGRTAAGAPNPVAITVIFTLPLSDGSTTAPKMMLASSCAASCTMDDASLTSTSERSGPPVMLMITPRDP